MMEINYQAMFNELAKRMNEYLKADKEYFALMSLVNDKAKFATALGKEILKLPKSAQLQYMRCVSEAFLLAEELCNKYNLLDEEENNES